MHQLLGKVSAGTFDVLEKLKSVYSGHSIRAQFMAAGQSPEKQNLRWLPTVS